MSIHKPPHKDIDRSGAKDNRDAPAVRQRISQVGTVLQDPAPVPADGAHLAHGRRDRRRDERNDPYGPANDALARR